MGQVHSFAYKPYADYDQTAATDPVRNLKAPLMVVESYTAPSGHTTRYTDRDGKVHWHKGFLGFLHVNTLDSTTRVETRTEYALDETYYTLQPHKQETVVDGTPVSTTEQQYELLAADNTG